MVKAIGFGEESKYGEDIDVTKWITPVVDNIRKEHKAIIGHAVTGAKKGELFEFALHSTHAVTGAKKGELFEFALHSTPILTFPPTRWQRLKAWARSTFRRLVAWIREEEPVGEVKALDAVYGTLAELGRRCHMLPKDGD